MGGTVIPWKPLSARDRQARDEFAHFGYPVIMKRIDLVKTIKIAAGCVGAYLLAGQAGLSYSTSVITITLLSILGTRKDTFITAGKRFLAFFTAAATAFLLFPALNYSVASLFLYLLFFYLFCQAGRFTEGFSMSTVLMLHIWGAKQFTPAQFFNEFFLMSIGIITAFLMNLYMPGKVAQIRAYQKQIEEAMGSILLHMAGVLRTRACDNDLEEQLDALGQSLDAALQNALYTEKNHVFRDMSYYVTYIKMRTHQYEFLKRIRSNLPRLHGPYNQTMLVARFMEDTAKSIYEYNNSKDLIARLAVLRRHFRQAPLPVTREEFESRAVLYEIVSELETLLHLKMDFADHLTDYQIRTFWKL